jgi:hypothetical protein
MIPDRNPTPWRMNHEEAICRWIVDVVANACPGNDGVPTVVAG